MSRSFFDQYANGKDVDRLPRMETRLFEILFSPDIDFHNLSAYDRSVALKRAMDQVEVEEARMYDDEARYAMGSVAIAYLARQIWTGLRWIHGQSSGMISMLLAPIREYVSADKALRADRDRLAREAKDRRLISARIEALDSERDRLVKLRESLP